MKFAESLYLVEIIGDSTSPCGTWFAISFPRRHAVISYPEERRGYGDAVSRRHYQSHDDGSPRCVA
jgi:hypothetical protein